MSFRWEAYLELAQHLATGPAAPKVAAEGAAGEQAPPPAPRPDSSEAALRTAVSRAYYSAYHLAREYVERSNLATVGREDAHKSVWKALQNTGGRPRPRQEKRIGNEGNLLHDMRKRADYEIDPRDWHGQVTTLEARQRKWKEEAALAVQRAGIIAKLLGELTPRN